MKCFLKMTGTCILGPLWMFGFFLLGLIISVVMIGLCIPVAAGCSNKDISNLGIKQTSWFLDLLDKWRNL